MSLDSRNQPKGSSSGESGSSKSSTGKDTKKQTNDACSTRLRKAEKQLVLTNKPDETLADVDNLIDISDRPTPRTSQKKTITPILPPDD